MASPSARLLQLLTLLQARARWSGRDLAERLGVSPRTLRYDTDKLRQLGYPVQGGPGAAAGYALRPGTNMPPLPFNDDETVAMALGLRLAAVGVGDLGESAGMALAKLEQVLPQRLRDRVRALRDYTASVPQGDAGVVDPDLVLFLTGACRDRHRVRFVHRRQRTDQPSRGRALPGHPARGPLVPSGVRPGPRRLAQLPAGPARRQAARGCSLRASSSAGPHGAAHLHTRRLPQARRGRPRRGVSRGRRRPGADVGTRASCQLRTLPRNRHRCHRLQRGAAPAHARPELHDRGGPNEVRAALHALSQRAAVS